MHHLTIEGKCRAESLESNIHDVDEEAKTLDEARRKKLNVQKSEVIEKAYRFKLLLQALVTSVEEKVK